MTSPGCSPDPVNEACASLDAFVYLARELNEAGSRWALLHALPLSPSGELTSDVDLVIDPRDRLRAERAVLSLPGMRVIQVRRYEFTSRTYVCEVAGGAILCLDMSTDIRAHGRVFSDAVDLLRNRVKIDDVLWSVPPHTEFAVCALKRLLKLRLPIGDEGQTGVARRLEELFEVDPDRATTTALTVLGSAAAEPIVRAAQESSWAELPDQQEMRASLLACTTGRHRMSFWAGELCRALDRFTRPEGLLVSVLGPDGVGKSAVIRGMLDHLSMGFASATTLHLRPYALGRRSDSPEASLEPHSRPLYGSLKSAAKLADWTLDYLIGWGTAVRPQLVRCG
ncbi:MAG: hypothetical protein U1E22_02270, partial [Coriobacteriia bacterium]|nr:hypothetical protein [Coriobacteriia bacterium]